MDVAVVGAGPAGLLLAVLLHRRGISVLGVFDQRRCVDQGTGRSVNVTLCQRGLRALEVAGLAEAVRRAGVPLRGVVWHDGEDGGTTFQAYGSTLAPATAAPASQLSCLWSVRRNDLTRILENAARRYNVPLFFKHKFIDVDAEQGEAIFEDGLTGDLIRKPCSAIVGADGCFSSVRKRCVSGNTNGGALSRTLNPGTFGETTLRHRLETAHAASLLEQHWLGYREVRVVDSEARMRKDAFHIWGRPQGDAFVLGLPSADSSLTLGLYADRLLLRSHRHTDAKALLCELFPQLAALLPCLTLPPDAALARAKEDATAESESVGIPTKNKEGLLCSVVCERLYFSMGDGRIRATLIGDAAHAMLPFCGQGANSALEDAFVLSERMAIATQQDDPGYGLAFAAYEAERHSGVVNMTEYSRNEARTLMNHLKLDKHLIKTVGGLQNRAISGVTRSKPSSIFDRLNFTSQLYGDIFAGLMSSDADGGSNDGQLREGVSVLAGRGAVVKKGDALASLEVLKSRRLLLADQDGVVESVRFDETLGVPIFNIVAVSTAGSGDDAAPLALPAVPAALATSPIPAIPPAIPSFSGSKLQRVLQTRHLGRQTLYRYTTESTMKDMAKEAVRGALHGTLILAEMQTAGRGRGNGRTWTSRPKGNLYFTLLLRGSEGRPSTSSSPTPPSRSSQSAQFRGGNDRDTVMVTLHYAVTVAVARACRRAGVNARIKWPNDIWANGRKMAGMLIDIVQSPESSEGLCVMVGIGINVHEDMRASADPEIAAGATSVCDELARDGEPSNKLAVSREVLLGDILNLLEESLTSCIPIFAGNSTVSNDPQGHSDRLFQWYRQLDLTVGNRIKVTSRSASTIKTPHEGYHATALDLDADGRLVVQLEDEDGNAISTKRLSSAMVSIRPDTKSNDIEGEEEGKNIASSRLKSVLVYNGPGAGLVCVAMTMRSLRDVCDPHRYKVKTIGPEQVRSGLWRQGCAAIVFPGGADRLYMKELHGEGNRHIREFVMCDAGCYLGFCAGAYYGSAKVLFDIGGPLEVHEDRELCFFPGHAIGPVFPGFDYASEKGARAAWLDTEDDTPAFAVYFNGGCFFEDGSGSGEGSTVWDSGARIVARYAQSVADGKSVSELAAVVHRKIGRGTAVLSGVHPEFIPSHMFAVIEEQDTTEGAAAKRNVRLSADRERMLQMLTECDAARVGLLQTLVQRLLGL